ncbi:Mu-like prophage major head subunit gpT family protein [Vibrio cholerae]|nr:Mu-like prophage major head subunit gpT family protein [Vibrio cholerae]
MCYDGQNFFDTDHPLDTTPATTFSNVVGDPSTDTGRLGSYSIHHKS